MEFQRFDSNRHVLLINDITTKFDSASLSVSNMKLHLKLKLKNFNNFIYDYKKTLTFINTVFVTKITIKNFEIKDDYEDIIDLLYTEYDHVCIVFQILSINVEYFSEKLEQGEHFL